MLVIKSHPKGKGGQKYKNSPHFLQVHNSEKEGTYNKVS